MYRGKSSSRVPRSHFSLQRFVPFMSDKRKLVVTLEVHPVIRGRLKVQSQPVSGIGSNPTSLSQDRTDASWRYLQSKCKCASRQTIWNHEVFAKNFTGMYRRRKPKWIAKDGHGFLPRMPTSVSRATSCVTRDTTSLVPNILNRHRFNAQHDVRRNSVELTGELASLLFAVEDALFFQLACEVLLTRPENGLHSGPPFRPLIQ